jgi:TPR repeat protein
MSNPSKKAKIASTSGGPFAKRPREMLVLILEFFSMYEVASLQRLVCHEFRDAGQERIHERGGRKLFEEAMAFYFGLDHYIIDKDRGHLLLEASTDASCKTALAMVRMSEPNLPNEDKPKILKDLKEISTSSPYHFVDYYIGEFYERGFGGEDKKNQAVAWLEKAVHNGNTRAMCALGVFYNNGDLGLTQSDTKAIELFALAADKGHAKARFYVGNSYREGNGGVEIDFNRCVELWKQSATQGNVNAQITLGDMYALGSEDGPPMTIPVDRQLCFRWNLAAAKQEDVISMKNIGMAYAEGDGVEQNNESAFEWSLKAAETGDEGAQWVAGFYYEYGVGVDVDLVQALHWYQKSAAQGFQAAIDAVERLS